MAKTVIVDSGSLVALLLRRDQYHPWVSSLAARLPPPWRTCEAALSEAFFLVGRTGRSQLAELVRRQLVVCSFSFADERVPTLDLMNKYADVPMSLADACLVRMTETLPDPVVVTTDGDFRLYRRHSRLIVPCLMP